MHGTSCVELERTVGPGGSAGGKKRVSRFTFCSVEPGHVNGGGVEEKDWFAPVLAVVPLRPGKDSYTFELPVTPERRGALFHVAERIYRNTLVVFAVVFADCGGGRRSPHHFVQIRHFHLQLFFSPELQWALKSRARRLIYQL